MADSMLTVTPGATEYRAITNNSGVVAGAISGTAQVIGSQTNNHYHPARLETPPSPSCAIPFRRDTDFVDRGTLLDQIYEKLSAPASRIALVGLGGVGKSQLAIEHCYRAADQSLETWVFWVHASNAARLEQGFQDIADRVKLAGRTDPQTNVFKLVHDWLRDEKHGRWLLVLDNADDAAVLSLPLNSGNGAPLHPLLKYLPPSRCGSVLVTSRTKHAASRLMEEDDIILIEPMHDGGAQALLNKKLGNKVNKDAIAELAEALEYMPLALVQSAAYIRKRAPDYSVQQYVEEFRKSEKKKTSLLNQQAGQHRRDGEAKNSVIITWQISFEHIHSTRRSAANLLSLMSFFDRQGIPKALLHDYEDAGPEDRNERDSDEKNGTSEASVNARFEDDVLTLRDYSFVSVTTDKDTLEMHSLVQLATREWLEGKKQAEGWRQQFIVSLSATFPIGEYENWEKCKRLLPHARTALTQPPKSEAACNKWALLLHNAAVYSFRRGNAGEAEEMATTSMKVRARLFGAESLETIGSIEMVGLARILGGRWKDAEELFVQVMETRKTKLGADHPDTLVSMSSLARTLKSQGSISRAISLMEECCQMRAVVFGPQHPHTISSRKALTTWRLEVIQTSEKK